MNTGKNMPNAIITGGSGFVGEHLTEYLLGLNKYDKIINIDLRPPADNSKYPDRNYRYLKMDIRETLAADPFKELGCDKDTVIFNLAAICRIPGYPDIDYFRTNILGAENVCDLARELDCRRIVFTSSIAPYGASEGLKTEESIPQPDNPYGSSKLVAEYIHRGWYGELPERCLTILRPGIIYGRNEQANFSRLYTSLKKGFFVYPGRKNTKKACIYVKDVARACEFFAEQNSGYELYNLVYKEAPSIEEICGVLYKETNVHKARFVVPGKLLILTAYVIKLIGQISNVDFTGIHPDRVKKVMISTNISGLKLSKTDFDLKYSLRKGIIDWFKECDGALY